MPARLNVNGLLIVVYARFGTRSVWVFVIALVAATVIVPARAQSDTDIGSAGILKWLPWIAFGGALHDRERAEGELWVPLAQTSNSVLFTHLQGKLFEADVREGNFALGYRQKMSPNWVGGFWLGYDLRRTPLNHSFHQVAGGFEALSRSLDLRANWYVPINRTETSTLEAVAGRATFIESDAVLGADGLEIFTTETTASWSGNRTVTERALYGVDAEVGLRLPIEQLFGNSSQAPEWLDDHEFKIFAGGYYFDSKQFEDEIAGGRLRLEWNVENILPAVAGSKLTLEADYQYDDVRKEQFEVGLRVRLPLGNHGWGNPAYNTVTYAERRMSDPIIRDTDIVAFEVASMTDMTRTETRSVIDRETAQDAVTGVRMDRVVQVTAQDDANAVISDAGANSLVVADGSAGTFTNQDIVLRDQQTLVGGGGSVLLVGSRTGRSATFVAPGSRPLIHQSTDNAAVRVGADTHVVGIDITGGGETGGHFNRGIVSADRDIANIHIDQVSISNMGGHGVRMHSGIENWSVRRTSISEIWDGNGIDFENNTTFAIDDSEISNIYRYSGDAIHMSAGNSGTLSNTHFGAGVREFLIRFSDDNTLLGDGNTAVEGTPRFQFFGTNNAVADGLFAAR